MDVAYLSQNRDAQNRGAYHFSPLALRSASMIAAKNGECPRFCPDFGAGYEQRMQPIQILIAHSHDIFRDGLRKLLETDPGFLVVGAPAMAGKLWTWYSNSTQHPSP